MKNFFTVFLLSMAILTVGSFIGMNYAASVTPGIVPAKPSLVTQAAKALPVQDSHTQDVTLLMAGDIMLGRSVTSRMRRDQDFLWPFLQVSTLLSEADITVGNLETTILDACPSSDSGFIFCADTRSIEGLKSAGLDLVSLANNHTLNYGRIGLDETINHLTQANIAYMGLDGPVLINRRGTIFGFLAFNDTGNLKGIANVGEGLVSEIKSASLQSDILVVNFHWGSEYRAEPAKRQIDLAHLAVDSGADIVIGHHPHWIQTSEIYQGKPVYYSLGNFIFDQDWSEETKKGLAVRFTYRDTELVATDELPVYIEENGQPHWLSAPGIDSI